MGAAAECCGDTRKTERRPYENKIEEEPVFEINKFEFTPDDKSASKKQNFRVDGYEEEKKTPKKTKKNQLEKQPKKTEVKDSTHHSKTASKKKRNEQSTMKEKQQFEEQKSNKEKDPPKEEKSNKRRKDASMFNPKLPQWCEAPPSSTNSERKQDHIPKESKDKAKKVETKRTPIKIPRPKGVPSVSNLDFEDIKKDMQSQIGKAIISCQTQSGENAVPFLITRSIFSDGYCLVFSRDSSDLVFSASFETIENYLIKSLTLPKMESKVVQDTISKVLENNAKQGNFLVGCVGDAEVNSKLYLIYFKDPHFKGQDGEMMEYGVSVLNPSSDTKKIESQLNKLSVEGQEFFLNIPIFTTNFQKVQFHIVVTIPGDSKTKYTLEEFPELDMFNYTLANQQKKKKFFKGVIMGTSFLDSYILYY